MRLVFYVWKIPFWTLGRMSCFVRHIVSNQNIFNFTSRHEKRLQSENRLAWQETGNTEQTSKVFLKAFLFLADKVQRQESWAVSSCWLLSTWDANVSVHFRTRERLKVIDILLFFRHHRSCSQSLLGLCCTVCFLPFLLPLPPPQKGGRGWSSRSLINFKWDDGMLNFHLIEQEMKEKLSTTYSGTLKATVCCCASLQPTEGRVLPFLSPDLEFPHFFLLTFFPPPT